MIAILAMFLFTFYGLGQLHDLLCDEPPIGENRERIIAVIISLVVVIGCGWYLYRQAMPIE